MKNRAINSEHRKFLTELHYLKSKYNRRIKLRKKYIEDLKILEDKYFLDEGKEKNHTRNLILMKGRSIYINFFEFEKFYFKKKLELETKFQEYKKIYIKEDNRKKRIFKKWG